MAIINGEQMTDPWAETESAVDRALNESFDRAVAMKTTPVLADVTAVIRLLDEAHLGILALGGGWCRELVGLDAPRPHGDIDVVVTNPDHDKLDAFMATVDEIDAKKSSSKRAFNWRGVLVELFLVYKASASPRQK